ncbi:LamG-like jellyroll fold domain-containing protein [Leptospira vanthielii]|uniref:Concanavalin A-like lectin/glucanases family protein n=1 Tax=Leptospira vanthielii serovar Holland str. Waz Holland = ATCC 700522 TaxID=1218591 RepID=N1WDS4_9LEPT|nr:LamG-like jellyroll fold domain-containing protein [Leptospira vanthielii]EMY71525.1 concanavalin A-like lectin/glucanases family protein [Leptospira vanthielii serovar Holland str. Waz Holland = ATCC 700522]
MKRFTLPLVFLILLSSCRFPSLERDPLEFLAFLRFFSSSQFTGHSVGGAVSGLSTGASVTLTNNQDSVTVTSDGNFIFPKKLSSGQSYNVSLVTNGAGLTCTLTNGQGVVQSSNVNNINVTCGWGNNFYEVGVNVSGLIGMISVQNNAETLNIATNGLTKFTTLISTGSNYAVTITSQPVGTVCSFDDPTLTIGTMATANVTLFLTCVTGYLVGGNIHPTPNSDLGTNLIGRQTFLKTKAGSFPINSGGGGAMTGGAVVSATPTTARFNGPGMIVADGSFIYLADRANAVIRKIDKSNGTTTILAGGNSGGGTVCPGTITTNCKDGIGTAAEFNGITGLTTNGNNLFVLESTGRRIRRVNLTTSVVSTFAGSGNLASADNTSGILASFNNPSWITMFNGNLYVVDRDNCTIRVVNPTTTAVSTIAGGPTLCSFANDATGTNARFVSPIAAVGLGGYLYITDLGLGGGHKIRRLSLGGTNAVDTIAGDGVQASTDGIGIAAQFNDPHGLTTDGTNLFISEWSGHRIRHLNLSTGRVTTLVGSVSGYADNTGGNGLLNFPGYLISDGLNIYIADSGNHSLRYLEPSELLRFTFDGNTNDSIGTNHGIIAGGPTPTMDENGLTNGAYEFDGSGDLIQSTANIAPQISDNLTISAWVYPAGTDSAATQFIFYNGQGGSNGYGLAFESVGTSRRLYVSLGAVGPSGYTTMRLPLNQWSHVVLRRSNPNWQIYINGKPDSIVFTTNPILPANTFKVGDAGNGNYFKGKISDIRFFNGALDNDSIQKLAIQIPSGLISYFPFNGNTKDYGNFQNDLIITGATTTTTDRNGHPNGAYLFNGASYMQKVNPNGLPTGSNPRTICAWFNTTSSLDQYIVGFGTMGTSSGNGLVNTSTLTGMYGVADDVSLFHEGLMNQWVHLCGVYNSTTVSVFENGTLRVSGNKSWTTATGPTLEVGRLLDGTGNFSGKLDDIRIYNRVLSNSEIRTLSGHYPTQVSSWNPSIAGSRLKFFLMPEAASFGPGACSGGTNCIGIWDDRSGNGYHVSQVSAASQPNYNLTGINGSPGIRFLEGPATYLSRVCTPDLNSTSNTIFAVFSEANLVGNDGIFHNGTKLLYLPDNAGNILSLFDIQLNGPRLVSTANYNTANIPVLMSLDFDGSLGSIYKGGAVVGSNAVTGGTFSCLVGDLSIGRHFWGIGTYPTDGDYFDGFLGDIIYFDQVLSTSDRETVECYLSNKYNLPVGHSCP